MRDFYFVAKDADEMVRKSFYENVAAVQFENIFNIKFLILYFIFIIFFNIILYFYYIF